VGSDSQPLDTNLVAGATAALPDANGHWSAGFPIQGGSGLELDPGATTTTAAAQAVNTEPAFTG